MAMGRPRGENNREADNNVVASLVTLDTNPIIMKREVHARQGTPHHGLPVATSFSPKKA